MDKQVKIDRLKKNVKRWGELFFEDSSYYQNLMIKKIAYDYIEVKYKGWREPIKIYFDRINDKILNHAERKLSRHLLSSKLAA